MKLCPCKVNTRFLHISRFCLKTYYDVLKISKDSSSKDIRKAYIKLSKELHPDKHQNSSKNHAEFVKLNEAYSVLSRPDKRRDYDIKLRYRFYENSNSYHHQENRYGQPPPWTNSSFYENRDESEGKNFEDVPYYGIKGLKRVSNASIAVILILFTTIGLGIQIAAIRYSFTLKREEMNERSKMLSVQYNAIRNKASKTTTEEQLDIIFKENELEYYESNNSESSEDIESKELPQQDEIDDLET